MPRKTAPAGSVFPQAGQRCCPREASECLFTEFLLEHNLPLTVSGHSGPLLRKVFPTSDVAKRYPCARTKTTAVVGEMANYAQERMVSSLKRNVFAVAVDASNDSQAQLYPIVMTYYVEESGLVESKLFCLNALEGQASGRSIGRLITEALASFHIPITNCIASCSDNANVILGGKNGVAAVLTEAHQNVIKIGCPCTMPMPMPINLAAEKAALCLPSKVDKVLVDIFYYLEKSAKRKSTLRQFQEMHSAEFRKILKHVPTR